ncbi:MAG TPA: GTPase, partial [Thermoplasmatales archaeon]|nr:GTPase [Thermoplasmatales archaeon]
ASYPFTTQSIYVGHREEKINHNIIQYQLIDTPGLLDRPLEKRNKIEKQAIAALAHLADLIIFILDPTEHCGYSMEEQRNLLNRVRRMFSSVPLIVVENKADIIKRKSPHIKISCTTGDGIQNLLKKIREILENSKS